MNDGFDKAQALTNIVNQYFGGDDGAFKAWSTQKNDALDGQSPAQALVEDPKYGHYRLQAALATQQIKLAPAA
jgi:hypothetical protein